MDRRIDDALQRLAARGVYVARGPEADRHLAGVRARAAYLPVDGEPGIVIVGADATYADVMHEEFHALQHEASNWRAWDSTEQPRMELEAHRFVLENAAEWGLSDQEREEHARLLEYWQGRVE